MRGPGGPEGLLIVDKPVGPTSFDVIRTLRRALHTRALGHTGTLDPAASGVLCIAAGWALKLIRFLPHERKVYEAVVRLGQVTDTDDAAGTVVAERPVQVDDGRIAAALAELTGDIWQRPPAYSALHVNGERAYAKARRGERVELPPRPVRVEHIETLWRDLPRLGIRVTCGPGTYIRSLARDLGEKLSCGAHLASLRRIANGPFTIDRAVPLDRVPEGEPPLLSSSEMLSHLPSVCLPPDQLSKVHLGQRVALPEPIGEAAVRVLDEAGRLQAVATPVNEGTALQPVRVRS